MIMTGWKDALSPFQCRTGNRALLRDFRSLGEFEARFISLWQHEAIIKQAMIASIGVDGDNARRLGSKYDQPAIIYWGPETCGDIYVLARSGDVKVTPGDLPRVYSWATGSGRECMGFCYPAQSYAERAIDAALAK